METKPTYTKHKDADWSSVYYGESLADYFPRVPSSTQKDGHWYFQFMFEKYHPLIDVYVQYIKGDLKRTGLSDKVVFCKENKINLKIFLQRMFYVKEFLKYFSFKEIYHLLTQPAYMEIYIT